MEKEPLFNVKNVDDVMVIEIVGDLDVTTSPRLKVKLESLIRFGYQKIVVNLGKVNMLDSTGVGSLIYGLKMIDQTMGDLKLAELSPHHANIFNVLELDRVFSIFPNEDLAISSFLSDSATMH
ncbi:MAG: STAS domain-containing protein [bacterium]